MKERTFGLGVFDVVGIVFITLKLLRVIDWSWWWVLSPLWASIVLIFIMLGILQGISKRKY